MPADALLKRVFVAAGGVSLIRLRNAAANRILTYHSFHPATINGLERQCEHIRRYYHPVSLDTVAAFVREGAPVPRNSLAVTVDDGYRNFRTYAHPVFKRFEIPVTVFLMTGFLDGIAKPWWDQLHFAFLNSPLRKVSIRIGTVLQNELVLADQPSRRHALATVTEALKTVSNAERLAFLAGLPDLLNVRMPEAWPWPAMSWDEVRQLSSEGVTFGAHTRTHPILASLRNEDEIEEEIAGSAARIQAELGSPPLHFSYPNGLTGDIDGRVRRITKSTGFRTAVSAIPGLVWRGDDPFMLKRLSMDADMSLSYFSRRLAGAIFDTPAPERRAFSHAGR